MIFRFIKSGKEVNVSDKVRVVVELLILPPIRSWNVKFCGTVVKKPSLVSPNGSVNSSL